MGVSWLTVSVRAWHPDGKRVPDATFIRRLCPKPTTAVIEAHRSRGEWEAARIELVAVRINAFANANEPTEAFAATMREQLLRAADWLAGLPATAFNELRRGGFKTDVFIGSWIDQDQFELELPPEFVAACGRVGLGLSLLTND
jgi:hypothetical protein